LRNVRVSVNEADYNTTKKIMHDNTVDNIAGRSRNIAVSKARRLAASVDAECSQPGSNTMLKTKSAKD
jgi:hypothetical protein